MKSRLSVEAFFYRRKKRRSSQAKRPVSAIAKKTNITAAIDSWSCSHVPEAMLRA